MTTRNDLPEIVPSDPEAAVGLIDRLVAHRAKLYQEYERLGLILAEIAEKASKTATATPPKPRKRRRKGMPVMENAE